MTDPRYRPRRAAGPFPTDPDDDRHHPDRLTPAATAPATPVPSWYGPVSSPRPTSPATPVRVPPDRSGSPVAPIELRGLSKTFGPVVAVDDLTFSVQPGRVTGFLGPNGAGKTTTLRMLVGLATPTAGTATFGGRAYAELPRPQQVVGTVLDASFHPGRTGRDHLRVLAATAGAGDDRVDELLERVDLTAAARRTVGTYSLGMRQRLALATALLGDPDYLVLDEPANGLDPEGIRWLRGFLRSVASAGKVVLVSSHQLGEVQETVDDVAVIGRGRLLRCAPIDQIEIAEPMARVRTAQPARTADVLTAAGFSVHPGTDADGPVLRVASLDTVRIGALLLEHRIAVIELGRERFNLEESFFRMLEQETDRPAPGPAVP